MHNRITNDSVIAGYFARTSNDATLAKSSYCQNAGKRRRNRAGVSFDSGIRRASVIKGTRCGPNDTGVRPRCREAMLFSPREAIKIWIKIPRRMRKRINTPAARAPRRSSADPINDYVYSRQIYPRNRRFTTAPYIITPAVLSPPRGCAPVGS